jgi:hypothetical protein
MVAAQGQIPLKQAQINTFYPPLDKPSGKAARQTTADNDDIARGASRHAMGLREI